MSTILTKLRIILGIDEHDNRPKNSRWEHYNIETGLARVLKEANAAERLNLYGELYNELYKKVPELPQLHRPAITRARDIKSQMSLLRPFIKNETSFLEIGAGDCGLSFEVAKHVREVVAVETSGAKLKDCESRPPNLELVIAEGCNFDVLPGSVDVAFSNQVIEHLHPDDAPLQQQNIYTALVPGGIYICTTPHRFSGPHDVSRNFDMVASGFHLKEYTYHEIKRMFEAVGFSEINGIVKIRGRSVILPLYSLITLEKLLNILPQKLCKAAARTLPLSTLLGIKVVAIKPEN